MLYCGLEGYVRAIVLEIMRGVYTCLVCIVTCISVCVMRRVPLV